MTRDIEKGREREEEGRKGGDQERGRRGREERMEGVRREGKNKN